jgi:hypothetical protein
MIMIARIGVFVGCKYGSEVGLGGSTLSIEKRPWLPKYSFTLFQFIYLFTKKYNCRKINHNLPSWFWILEKK